MSTEWYALRVKPHKEVSVCQLIQAREVELFYPTLKVQSRRGRSEKPYFPGYLFIHVNLSPLGIHAFSWIPGTHGLVAFGGEPAIVPAQFIETLKSRLQQLERQKNLPPPIQPGDKVRIVNGPFQGYEAIFDTHVPGKERVQILLSFLSRQQRLKLDRASVEKV